MSDWSQLGTIATGCVYEVQQAQLAIFNMSARTEPIYYYKTPDYTFVEDPNFDGNWGFSDQADKDNYTGIPESGSVTAKVTYPNPDLFTTHVGGDDDISIRGNQDRAEIKVCVLESGYNQLKDSEKYMWGGELFTRKGNWRKLGILGNFYVYCLELKRSN